MTSFFDFDFPSYEKWSIQRIDFSYVWKLESFTQVQDVIDLLKQREMPRKETLTFSHGVKFKSGSSVVFYAKQPAYKKYDYKRIKKRNPELADYLNKKSENILRFEYQIRKKQLQTFFKTNEIIHIRDINNQKLIEEILNDQLSTILKGTDFSFLNFRQAFNKLKQAFPPKNKQDKKYFMYFLLLKTYYSSAFMKRIWLSAYSNSTINKYFQKIQTVNINILSNKKHLKNLKLTIPSELTVNKTTVAGAAALQLPINKEVNEPTQKELFN